MAIAGRRWITNVARWSCIAISTGLGIWNTLQIELALHPLSHVNIRLHTIFLASAGLFSEGCGPACISKEQAKISDPSGLTFVITETNCDLVGNTIATTIEAYGQGDSKTTLFKYGLDDRSGMPQIAVQCNRIVIEIDSVLDISRQENRYKTYQVDYKIKHFEYPQK
jgi:hypothetical protein